MDIPRYTVDSSVVTKWHLQDEELVEPSQKVFDDFLQGKIRLTAPDQLRHELASALLQATLPRTDYPVRLLRDRARQSLQAFLGLGIEFVDHGHLVIPAFNLASRFGCSYYDGLYLAVAELTDSPFLFADNKLRNALDNRFPLVVWIDEYR